MPRSPNYKLLQFFDTLALYFQLTHQAGRGDSYFENVLRALGQDVTITIRRVEVGLYALSPYPFRKDKLMLSYRTYAMMSQAKGIDLKELLA